MEPQLRPPRMASAMGKKISEMKLTAISGKVSHVVRTTSTGGGGTKGAPVGTAHNTAFRLDGRQIQIQGSVSWLSEGDHVTIIGEAQGSNIEPLAARNDTSGYESIDGHVSKKISIFLIVIGVITIPIFIGWPVLALGTWFLSVGMKKNKQIDEAATILRGIPRSTAIQSE
ncbi:hypothetical protein [Pelagicoccus sp. SDUM812002]|uniref:hypothetical protein n=1 Tax=Pelagicoccus sp. SDUM812002 TaxID=3041266 RepID=UPI0028121EB3|nr:hypothetical protein [Pelagicoccus sp. SDUM812002]